MWNLLVPGKFWNSKVGLSLFFWRHQWRSTSALGKIRHDKKGKQKSYKFEVTWHFLCTCLNIHILCFCHIEFFSHLNIPHSTKKCKESLVVFQLGLISCIVFRSNWLCCLLQAEWWMSHKLVTGSCSHCDTSTFSFSRLIHHSVILFPKANQFIAEANKGLSGSALVETR